jgi:hypothetical protein
VAWILGDLGVFVHWRLLGIVTAGGGHIATKFAAMGVIYLGVHALSSDVPLELPGIGPLPPRSAIFLALTIGCGVALLSLTALLRYSVRRQALRLSRRYLEFCMRRVIAIASRLPDPRAPVASRLIGQDVPHVFLGYARFCGMASQQLLRLAPTSASFLVGCLVLLWLDATLTALLALFGLLTFAAQYPANNQAARASHAWEQTRRSAAQRLMQAFARLRRDPVALDPGSPALDEVFHDPTLQTNLDSLTERIHAGEKADLVSRIGSGALLGGAILLVGIDILEGSRTWAGVAAYLAAVRFTLGDFVSMSRLTTGLTRYHAQIDRYRQLVTDSRALAEPAPGAGPVLPLRLRLSGPVDPSARLVLEPGIVASIILPPRTHTGTGFLLMQAADLDDGRGFVPPLEIDDFPLDSGLSLRANLGLPPELDEAAVAAAVAPFTPVTAIPPVFGPGWLDRATELGWNAELPRWALRALRVIAAARRGAPIVALSAAQYAQLPEIWRSACRRELTRALLLIVHRDLTHAGQFDEHAAILCDGRRLTGWVPFPAEPANAATLELSFTRLVGVPARMLGGGDTADETTDEIV